MAEALMKPAITGWLKKLARKPSRNTPINISIRPDNSASTSTIWVYSAESGGASAEALAAVISAITATGPTARLRLLPKSA